MVYLGLRTDVPFRQFSPPCPLSFCTIYYFDARTEMTPLHFLLIFIEVSSITPDGLLKSLPNSCGITCVCFLEMWKVIYPSDVVLFFVFLLSSSQHTRQLVFATVILFLIFYPLLNSQERSLGEMEKWWLVCFLTFSSSLAFISTNPVRVNLCANSFCEHCSTQSDIYSPRLHKNMAGLL